MRLAIVVFLFFLGAGTPAALAAELSEVEIARFSRDAVFGSPADQAAALAALTDRGQPDVAAALILAMRYRRDPEQRALDAFRAVTGADVDGWFEAMLWQQAHDEVAPHPSYRPIKIDLLARIDPAFLRFLGGSRSRREGMAIRLEEIAWGGVRVDGIPALDNPTLIEAGDAGYLAPDDLVFGVEINGDARAYPLRIMGWHEMFNDVIGGVPVALAYCTLCGSGILFETAVEGRDAPFVFGSSGFLYRSNKLMFDRQTDSLWNQFTGRPVVGPLVGSGIELKIRPVAITTWARWRDRNPDTRVLSLDTGHDRDYGSGVVYREYFASPDLMFPALVETGADLPAQKEYVFGIRTAGGAKAWPLARFEGGAVITDRVGLTEVVLIGDAASRTVRAYDASGLRFSGTPDRIEADGQAWRITESDLVGADGRALSRVPGHVAYWFAWAGYLGSETVSPR